ncbi:MAG: hypothetical protein ACOC95_01255 [Planctomycetota bacterium]
MELIDHDLHVHTGLSACCHDPEGQTPERIAQAATAMGVGTVGLADHVWANPGVAPSAWYAPQTIDRIIALRQRVPAEVAGVRMLVGCEAETIAPGVFGITPDTAARVDYVHLACSHFHMTHFVAQPASARPVDVADHALTFFRSAASSGLATIIPHPFLTLGFQDVIPAMVATISDDEFGDAFGLAAAHGVGIEITVGYLSDPARRDAALRLLTLAKQAGCRFTFGTDAHDPAALTRLGELAHFAEALNLTVDNILPLARRSGPTSVGAPPDDPLTG